MNNQVRPGPLAMLGSGEFLPVMVDLDVLLLEGRPRRVVHLPTASGLEGPARLRYWSELAASHFASIDAEVVTLPVLDRFGADDVALASKIAGAGMVVMSGGSPAHLVASLSETRVWQAVLDAWLLGAAVSGCSAGAMAMSSVLPAFRSEEGDGLGLVDGICVLPHYDRFGKMMKPVVRMHDRHITVVGIDENTALYGNPGSWTAYGAGAVHVFGERGRTHHRAGEPVALG